MKSRLSRVIGFLRPKRRSILLVLLLAVAMAAAAALEPLVVKYVFDHVTVGSAVALGIGVMLALSIVREAAAALQNWLTWKTRIEVQYALTETTVGRLQQLPMAFHRSAGVGGTMTRLDRGVQGFVTAASEIAFSVVPAAAYLVLALAMMFRLSARLGLLAILFAPAPVLIAKLAAREQLGRERKLMDLWTRIYARFNEVLSGIITVKSFAMEDREKARFLSEVRIANAVVFRGLRRDSAINALQNVCIAVARIAVIGYGAVLVSREQVTLGTLVAFIGYVGSMFTPITTLSNVYKTLRTASVSIDQVFSILDQQDTLGDAPDAVEVPRLRGEVEFDNVRFTYGRRATDRPLIDGVSLKTRPGEYVALVGPSGAGKSTLISLLCRFYDPLEGAVRIDGVDVRAMKQKSLRRQLGVVFQDALLFNESVRANIAYGKSDATQDEVEAAARAAHAHEFILRLPRGYDTVVGERGNLLSTGERQRVAIARSLLMDPPVLILDEPTSALDAESEALVQEALARLTKGRTTFAIAHRLGTVVGADRIVVLKDGRLIEQGTHAELMARAGYYRSLVERQTRGLLPATDSTGVPPGAAEDDRRKHAVDFIAPPELPP
ncbi:MAG: ABC transporter ATP-binding protein [Myxococcales bacterium]